MNTLCKYKLFSRTPAFLLGLALGLCTTPSFAVHDEGIFELEGNAVQNAVAPPYDWETLYHGGLNDGGNTTAFTGIVDDVPNASGIDSSIFTGGRKDIQPISQWAHKTGSSPDKDEITNAYAAAYIHNNDLIVYFGADRISNKGDAFMGFWFFKQNVEATADGSFSGNHTNGDVLVLTNFPQASNAMPEIRVDVWDSSCSKAANNNPQVGQCDAANLRLLHKSNAICGANANDLVCAITNDEGGINDPTPSPWPYQSKNSNTANVFPYETFFEGGINLTQLVGGDSCFSSFMAETRSSSEFTATLKDFVLHDFNLCSIAVTKTCSASELTAGNQFLIDYSIMLTNTGAGSIGASETITIDDAPSNGTAFQLMDTVANYDDDANGWAPDEVITVTGQYLSDVNGGTNTVDAQVSFGTASIVADQYTAPCDSLAFSPMLSIKKNCSLSLEDQGGLIAVRKDFDVTVCNTGDVPLDVNLTDSIDLSLNDNFSLDFSKQCLQDSDCGTGYTCNGELMCADTQGMLEGYFGGAVCNVTTGNYLPDSLPSGATGILSNTATAKATSPVADTGDLATIGNSDTAMCPLCPLSEEEE